jgi:hypothetical protein
MPGRHVSNKLSAFVSSSISVARTRTRSGEEKIGDALPAVHQQFGASTSSGQ